MPTIASGTLLVKNSQITYTNIIEHMQVIKNHGRSI